MPEHVTITDPELHEPKNISTAIVGQAYVADGAGSGAWEEVLTVTSGKSVIVKSMTDFPAAVAGVITLEDATEYVIVDDLSTSDRFVMGADTLVRAADAVIYVLTYTGSGTLFSGVDVSYSIVNLGIIASSGTVFGGSDISSPGSSVLLIQGVIVYSCVNLGNIDNLDTLVTSSCTFVASSDGFIFTGSSNRQAVSHLCEIIMGGGAYYNLGTAIFQAVSVNDYAATLSAGSNLLSGATASANITTGGLGFISFGRHSGVGTPILGITNADARWQFIGNDDITDTRSDALLSITGNTTETVISVVDTPVLVLGTWNEERVSQFSSTAAGRVTYVGGKNAVIPITASLTCKTASGGDKDVSFYIAKNGTVVSNSKTSNTVKLTNPGNTTIIWQDEAVNGDYYEIFVENNSDTINIIVIDTKLRIN